MARKLLLGLHDNGLARLAVNTGIICGYSSISSNSQEELLREASKGDYDACIMDANYGFPNTTNIEASYEIWQLFEPKVKIGKARFMTLAGGDDTIEEARLLGVPAVNKSGFDIIGFLRI